MRGFRKTAAPGAYNLRFRPSQGLDNIYVHYWANIHAPNGQESVSNITLLVILVINIDGVIAQN